MPSPTQRAWLGRHTDDARGDVVFVERAMVGGNRKSVVDHTTCVNQSLTVAVVSHERTDYLLHVDLARAVVGSW